MRQWATEEEKWEFKVIEFNSISQFNSKKHKSTDFIKISLNSQKVNLHANLKTFCRKFHKILHACLNIQQLESLKASWFINVFN